MVVVLEKGRETQSFRLGDFAEEKMLPLVLSIRSER